MYEPAAGASPLSLLSQLRIFFTKSACDGLAKRFHLDTLFQRPLGSRAINRRNSTNSSASSVPNVRINSQAHKDSREAIWSDLPKVYGIAGSWAELEVSESNVALHLQFLLQTKNTASRENQIVELLSL